MVRVRIFAENMTDNSVKLVESLQRFDYDEAVHFLGLRGFKSAYKQGEDRDSLPHDYVTDLGEVRLWADICLSPY